MGTHPLKEVTGRILSIGHSTMPIEVFLDQLFLAGVTVVADVRSSPVSRFPHFCMNYLKPVLNNAGIDYLFMGEELGGRPKHEWLYKNGIADYEKMAEEPEFKRGLQRLVDGAKTQTIAMVCSEYNPLDCHRCLLVGRALREKGIEVGHILAEAKVVEHEAVEQKLLQLAASVESDLFVSTAEKLTRAYRLRSLKVAYRKRSPKQISN